MASTKKGLLERLAEGVVIGDGGYVFELEKRGYVLGGAWTPEAVVEHPEAVRQLHREFLRAGSDVLQAFTHYASDEKLQFNKASGQTAITCKEICIKGSQLAREVADEGGALMAGSISKNIAFQLGKDKAYIQAAVAKQVEIFKSQKADFLICEFFNDIVEIQWSIEEALKSGLPVVATMCIGVQGDINKVSPGECAVKMAESGACVVGVNCLFDPDMTIETIKMMKAGLQAKGLNTYMMTQPNGCFTTGTGVSGYIECPEYPFAMEARTITRFDAHKYARQAYEIGVRYIGGCCGFAAYHIRALAEELTAERGGRLPPASDKNQPWGTALQYSGTEMNRKRGFRSHWENMVPHSGRSEPPTYPLPTTN